MSYNYKISARWCYIYGVSAVWRISQYFLNMTLQVSIDWLVRNVITSIVTNLVTLYDFALHMCSFLICWAILEIFVVLKFPINGSRTGTACSICLDFTKLIMQTYDKNRPFAAKFVKKRTLSCKFRQAGPVSYSLTKWSCVPESWKTSLVTNFWQAGPKWQSSD